MVSLVSIQAKSLEIQQRFHEIASREKDPVQAMFQRPRYTLVRQKVKELGAQIQQLSTKEPKNLELQEIWNKSLPEEKLASASAFDMGLQTIHEIAKHNSMTSRIPADNPFYGSDLVVYKHYYAGALPPNGIREDDFQQISRLYQRIKDNKTNMKLVGTDGERGELLHAIKTLLTRKTGRALLQDLVSRKYRGEPIELYFGNTSSALDKTQGGLAIRLARNRETLICLLPDGRKLSDTPPLAIVLGHEMIHMRHILKKDVAPQYFSEEGDLEEQRTMFGKAEGVAYNPIHENALREELGYLPRGSYKAGASEHASPWLRLQNGEGIDGDLPEILEKIDSLSNLQACLTYAATHDKIELLETLYPLFERLHATPEQRDQVLIKLLNGSIPSSRRVFTWLLARIENLHSATKQLLATNCKDIYKIRYLLSRGVDPNQQDEEGLTALDHLAKTRFHLSDNPEEARLRVLQTLLDAGAERIPALFLKDALTAKNWALVKKIAAQHPDMVFRTPATRSDFASCDLAALSPEELRLYLLESLVEPALVETLLDEFQRRGLSLDYNNHLGQTPLHLAATKDIPDRTFEMLLAKGAPLNAQTKSELRTPLHLACQQDQPAKVAMLLERQADQSLKDVFWYGPTTSNNTILELLAEHQLKTNIESPILKEAFDRKYTSLAISSYSDDRFPRLKECMLKNKLQEALQTRDVRAAELLFENGAWKLKEAEKWIEEANQPEIRELLRVRLHPPPPPPLAHRVELPAQPKSCFKTFLSYMPHFVQTRLRRAS